MTMSAGSRPSPSFANTGHSTPAAIRIDPKMIKARLIVMAPFQARLGKYSNRATYRRSERCAPISRELRRMRRIERRSIVTLQHAHRLPAQLRVKEAKRRGRHQLLNGFCAGPGPHLFKPAKIVIMSETFRDITPKAAET